MVYQLQRPSIEKILNYCQDLLSDEKLEVFEFGKNCDLVLHIYKDVDQDIRIFTAQDSEYIDETDFIHTSEVNFLRQELQRIFQF